MDAARGPHPPARRALAVLAALVAVATLAACDPTLPKGYQAVAVRPLTSTGGGAIGVASNGTASLAWSKSAKGDARVVWTAAGLRPTRDHQSCATWRRWDGHTSQPGIALRVRTDGTRTRAITLTDNVTYGARWAFNVHVWDTAQRDASGAVTFTKVGGAALTDTFYRDGRIAALPWRVCARVEGSTFTFKAWPTTIAEPAWGDARYGAAFTLPASTAYDGAPGWYAGHLEGSQQLGQSDQVAGPVPTSSLRVASAPKTRWRWVDPWPAPTSAASDAGERAAADPDAAP